MLLVQITSMMEPDDKSGWVPNQLIRVMLSPTSRGLPEWQGVD
jgi:hypothetical protein